MISGDPQNEPSSPLTLKVHPHTHRHPITPAVDDASDKIEGEALAILERARARSAHLTAERLKKLSKMTGKGEDAIERWFHRNHDAATTPVMSPLESPVESVHCPRGADGQLSADQVLARLQRCLDASGAPRNLDSYMEMIRLVWDQRDNGVRVSFAAALSKTRDSAILERHAL